MADYHNESKNWTLRNDFGPVSGSDGALGKVLFSAPIHNPQLLSNVFVEW